MNGMPLPLAVMITIPEPWVKNKAMDQARRDFYQYYSTMMEPWDGPASILFSDGDIMGAVLDRNGLRPSRYYITNDDYLILSSEVGVLPIPESRIKLKDRLNARLKKLQNKNKENKNLGVRKSEFIGLQAMLLQQKMTHNSNENSKENSANSSFSEINENKDKRRSTVNDLINSIPVTKKKKKSKMIFLGD